jgi:hypothetical protein
MAFTALITMSQNSYPYCMEKQKTPLLQVHKLHYLIFS